MVTPAVPEEQQQQRNSSWTSWRTLVTLFLALGCGFLTFNFHYIINAAHIHVSLAHHHRTTAFCAFTGCKLGDGAHGERCWA